ncbi:YodC family protein [Geobacter benzoatilyticus]|uniref:DUF2158 domain-containing protein n=1 Tax=Geobacter benzoatilyticus TaxID=2815309 RepID=A0ABX7Q1Q1_9BACT|nr:DUF2158 domain-containing protein [Geobacter benzoatilyticus]QSV44995.1 DUF2158 domain-containing protein [Geobacter benzoatilyticus]
MKMENLSVGDLVRLKSGGPTMTVSAPVEPFGTHDPEVVCDWFSKDKFFRETFTITTLEKVEAVEA